MTSEPLDHPFESPVLYVEPSVAANGQPGTFWEIVSPAASRIVSMDALKKDASKFKETSLVVVFEDAKPALKSLLHHGIDVARPICLNTLERLTESAKTSGDPFERLAELMQLAEEIDCKPLARLECLALRSFSAMEHMGLYIDRPKWVNVVHQKQALAKSAQKSCENHLAPFSDRDLFGDPIVDLNQLELIRPLFEKVMDTKLESLTIEHLRNVDHPLAKAFIIYKEASKLVSTYGERFLDYLDPKTGRIHADFNSLGTSTGRVSCQKPNLQNLPSDPNFTECLIAPKGRALVHADFSACELRVLAGLAQDPAFLSVINSDDDFHSAVATRIFKEKVSKTENTHLRERAKAINFGIIYGMGTLGLARSLEISTLEAQEILDRYFANFTNIKTYLEQCVSSATQLGYARTHLGRRLYFNKSNDATLDISRIAKNMPIQGTAAELAKLAMVRVHERLSSDFKSAFLVNMIHDELVVECDASQKDEVAAAVKEEMLGAQEALFSNVRPDVEVRVS